MSAGTLQVRPHVSDGHHVNGTGLIGNGSESHSTGGGAPISESRSNLPSHANATKSVQHQPSPNDTLLLPKFRKNQRKIDHSNHTKCCAPLPTGRPPNALPGSITRNELNLHGMAAHNIGTRDHMEDRHTIRYGRPQGLFKAFFGVFDGHGGEESSHFAHEHLTDYVEDELENAYRAKMNLPAPSDDPSSTSSASSVAPTTAASSSSSSSSASNQRPNYQITDANLVSLGIDYKQVLTRAFDRLEDEVLRQSRHIGCRDGTTATTVLLTSDTIFCANTGDSRTVLCRDNNAVALSTDHKPSSEEERARIIAAGGEVRAVMLDRQPFCCFAAKKVPHGAERLWPGGFSVSRAVGDIDYKDLRRKKATVVNVLIHRPDVTTMTRHARDQFIICGSDGLWDVLTNQQAVDFVLKELKKRKKEESCSDIAQKLADQAYSLGSEDNITALIVFLTPDLPFKNA